MKDSQSAIDHLARLAELAEALAAQGIAVFEHEYLALAFGSFRLELGTRRTRWGFSWDGKEGFLSVSAAYEPREGRRAPPVAGKAVGLGLGDLDAPFIWIKGFDFTE